MKKIASKGSILGGIQQRAKFGGMDTSMMTRMKELEDENRRLRKMYLEEKLKAEIANEYLAKK